jgi:hypothetical protein
VVRRRRDGHGYHGNHRYRFAGLSAPTREGTVKEGKPGKEGLKPGETADCSASFTVKQFEPPTISCTASPSTIKPGETSTVTAVGVEPAEPSADLQLLGSCRHGQRQRHHGDVLLDRRTDRRGGDHLQRVRRQGPGGNASTSVTITGPVCASGSSHPGALRRSASAPTRSVRTRVDNEAKACLDEVALTCSGSPMPRLVVVGEANAKERAKTAKEAAFALAQACQG